MPQDRENGSRNKNITSPSRSNPAKRLRLLSFRQLQPDSCGSPVAAQQARLASSGSSTFFKLFPTVSVFVGVRGCGSRSQMQIFSKRTRILTVFGLWTLFGIYSAVETHYLSQGWTSPLSWREAFLAEMSFCYLAATWTPVILWLSRRFRLERGRLLRHLPLHSVAMLIFAVSTRLTWDVLIWPVGLAFQHRIYETGVTAATMASSVFASFGYCAMLYWIVVAAECAGEYSVRYHRGLAEAAAMQFRLSEVRLQTMKLQMQPAFLFPALDTISMLVRQESEQAERMVSRLGEFLRMSLDHSSVTELPLSEELRFLDLYLAVERCRPGGRRIEVEVAPGVGDAVVPHLVLQSMLECARCGGAAVRLTVRGHANHLRITLGADFARHDFEDLAPLRQRLDALYGPRQSLVARGSRTGPWELALTLPLRRAARPEPMHSVQTAHAGA